MFSKTSEYALRAAIALGDNTREHSSAQAISDTTHVPVGYMSKVLQLLVQAGLVISQRGPGGGFCLAKNPAEVTMLDVVQAVEPIPRIQECPLKLKTHCVGLCPLHEKMDELAKCAEDTLRGTTIDQLMTQKLVPLGLDENNGFLG